jgi:uncharacterized protein affecting Mg2+/Co2+ transport
MDFETDYVTTQTDNIVISACQAFLEEDEENACGYYLRIENNSDDRIQLLGKNFNITDDRGNSYYDNTTGFKGELPELEPGEYFEFSTSAPMFAAQAVLYGSFQIMNERQNQIKSIKIPPVSLIGNSEVFTTLN